MKKIAILGAGSLGTILGAYISKKRQIDLIDVNEEHVRAMNENGAKVIGKIEMIVPVTAITPDQMEGIYDLVILLTKQLYNAASIEQLKPHLNEESVVITLQNGFPEPALIKMLGEERVMGATVNWGATWTEPGVSELTSDVNNLSFSMGRIDGKVTDKVKEVQEILEMMCEAHIETNLAGTRWAKLLSNAVFSGMSAALGCTFGDVLDGAITSEYAHYLCKETIDAGDAWGITSYPVGEINMKDFLYFTNEGERVEKAKNYEAFWRPHALLKASMLQDLEKGRKTEIHDINGLVSDTGNENGIATPFNDKIVEIVVGCENGVYQPTMDNLSLLEEVLNKYKY